MTNQAWGFVWVLGTVGLFGVQDVRADYGRRAECSFNGQIAHVRETITAQVESEEGARAFGFTAAGERDEAYGYAATIVFRFKYGLGIVSMPEIVTEQLGVARYDRHCELVEIRYWDARSI